MIETVIERMRETLAPLELAGDPRRHFHATYLRTTIAAAEEIQRGGFVDPVWVDRWDAVFAGFYLDALARAEAGEEPARPWRIAFGAPPGLPPLRHVLLGMNAHINFDLPQALIAVISDTEFGDATVMARRKADHETIDRVLSHRVAAEDAELAAASGPRTVLDRLLRPLNQRGTRRFLREAREKVWANAVLLSQSRQAGPAALAAVLAELEELCAEKVATLTAPGQVLLRLTASGFGVRLPARPTPGRRPR